MSGKTDRESRTAVLETNLKGAFACTRAASKVMSKQRYGRIINISSVVGEMGNPGQANYCASKAGLIGLTKSNALELARRNVTVNAITPGFIVTDMTDELSDKAKEELNSLDQQVNDFFRKPQNVLPGQGFHFIVFYRINFRNPGVRLNLIQVFFGTYFGSFATAAFRWSPERVG